MSAERFSSLLVVDDEESILGVVGEYFRRRGYQVLTAQSGRAALGILKEHRLDCCFTDINMPEMNGLDLVERIHQMDNTLPVIVMTGYPSLENSIRTVKNGVVDFLIKPINLKQMELSLQRVMRQRALFMENLLLKSEAQGKQRIEALNRELMSKIEELNTLNRIMGNFTTAASSANVFQRTVDIAREVVRAELAVFFVIHSTGASPYEIASARMGPPGPAPCAGAQGDESRPRPAAGAADDGGGGLVAGVSADGLPLLVIAGAGEGGRPRRRRSLMAVPVKIRDQLFGVLTAAAPADGRAFTEQDLYYLAFTTRTAAGAIENLALYENLYENLFATLYGFVNALEARDLYTREHSSRVTEIALVLGREMGCSAEELNILNFAGPLHDIGKIGIRDDILLKPGRLSTEEFEKIKEHPIIGANMLSQLGLWDQERRIIRCHHERFDGGGYPDGLRREEIPFLARILSLADAYDAMASDRAYRKRMEQGLILSNIEQGSGTQFDPRIVGVFQKAFREGKIAPPADPGAASFAL